MKDRTVLVCGIGEIASATARRLFLDGYGVALFRSTAPRMLRRRKCFSDAWYDGHAQLDGVEARRVDLSADFLLGLRTRKFIPLMRNRVADVLDRWPWDVIVAIHEDGEPLPARLIDQAGFTIGLGSGFDARTDCDIVIETQGPDPGRIIRNGSAGAAANRPEPDSLVVRAESDGLFFTETVIGDDVEPGASLGFVGDASVTSPASGRVIGVKRQGHAVTRSEPLVEIAREGTIAPQGVERRCALVARAVAFAIETDAEGVTVPDFEDWFLD